VASRYVCDGEDQVDLAVAAASQAITEAGITPDEIGLIVFAAAVAYQSIPATAPLIQARLGIKDGTCMAFDVNSTCLSFLTALDVASRLLGGKKAVVVASEVASRGLPWEEDPATAALFGDGAAAVVISGEDEAAGVVATRMETYPSAYEACQLASGGTRFDYHADRGNFDRNSRFRMDGETLYKLTIRHFEPFLDRLLGDAGWRRDEVELVVPHQASPGALAHLAKRCGFASDIVVNIVRDYGNQIAASLPTALHFARQGRPEGTKALMLGTSAGVSLGGMALIL
jgi:3-oxoacyl-[acyl-carrier-protein] synthase-3